MNILYLEQSPLGEGCTLTHTEPWSGRPARHGGRHHWRQRMVHLRPTRVAWLGLKLENAALAVPAPPRVVIGPVLVTNLRGMVRRPGVIGADT